MLVEGGDELEQMKPLAGGRSGATASPGDVVAYAAEHYSANETAVLESARPSDVPDGVEIVATRVTWRDRDTALFVDGSSGYLGAGCTRDWPVKGYGPTFDVNGFKVHEPMRVVVYFYLRVHKVGKYSISGVTLDYRRDGKLFRVESEGTALGLEVSKSNPSLCRGDPYFEPRPTPSSKAEKSPTSQTPVVTPDDD